MSSFASVGAGPAVTGLRYSVRELLPTMRIRALFLLAAHMAAAQGRNENVDGDESSHQESKEKNLFHAESPIYFFPYPIIFLYGPCAPIRRTIKLSCRIIMTKRLTPFVHCSGSETKQ